MRNEDRDWRNTEGPDARIARLAMRQHAVISYGQAIDAGLSRMAISRRVDAGRWVRLLPRVYRVGGAPATGRQGMMAATLWAGEGALLSHRAAGVLHGLDGVKAEHLEVTASKRLRSGVVLAHYAPPFTAIDRDVLDAIPVTSPTRTLIDLAGILCPDDLELAFEDARRRGLTSRARLGYRLASSRVTGGLGAGRCVRWSPTGAAGRTRAVLRRSVCGAASSGPGYRGRSRSTRSATGAASSLASISPIPSFALPSSTTPSDGILGGAHASRTSSVATGSPRSAGTSSTSPGQSWLPERRRR
jgi:Transcriptional regulator, AbiEi antitoxin